MRRVVAVVASSKAALSQGSWMIALLILLFLSCVSGWIYGPNVPDSYCMTTNDCTMDSRWTEPLPVCERNRCVCPSETCAVFTNAAVGYLYFCGPCGMLGSKCSNTTDCMVDWLCVNGFCECDQGSVYQGICVYYESVPTSVSSVVLIFILILIVVLQKLISSRKKLKKMCCKSSNESEDEESRVVASNPRGNEKTAAFTIANSEFMATAEDPDLMWALEFSRRLADQDELDASTLASTVSSLPFADPRFTGHPPPPSAAQPSTSGWRQTWSGAGVQRRSSRSSLSSTSSSRYSSGTFSSCNSRLPSASSRSSPSTPSVITSEEAPSSAQESVRTDSEDDEIQTTRV